MNIFLLITAVSLISGVSILSATTLDTQSSFNTAFMQSAMIEDAKKNEMVAAELGIDGSISVANHGQANSTIVKLEMFDGATSTYSTIFGQSVPGWQGIPITERDATIPPLGSVTLVDGGTIEASPYLTGYITTSFGNKVKITNNILQQELLAYLGGIGNNTNTGIGNGTATINGMGINSNIIQMEYDDSRITYGTGVIGEDKSLKPYLTVNATTNFAATILNDDTKLAYNIPAFWKEYQYANNTLVDVTPFKPNLIGYSTSKQMSGANTISLDPDGIHVSGNGKTILKLLNYSGQSLVLSGNASANSVLEVGTSLYDLFGVPYDQTYGFEIVSMPKDVSNTSRVDHYHSTNRYPYSYCHQHFPGSSLDFNPGVMMGLDSSHTVVYDYTHTPYTQHGVHQNLKHCHNWSPGSPYPGSVTLVIGASATNNGYLQVTNAVGGVSYGIFSGHVKFYDTDPTKPTVTFDNNFEMLFDFGDSTQHYLVVTSDGSAAVNIKGEANSDNNFLEIINLPANIPYQIAKDGLVIATGVTSASGQILIDDIGNAPSLTGGHLYLYPDSLAYRGAFSTVIFDNLHNETIHISTVEDKTYVVHAYAQIPVVGTVNVTSTDLDGTLDLPYLNKQYVGGAIFVPIIPGYDTINMDINGVSASLDYANILGGTGIKIADPATSTIPQYNLVSPLSSAEATVGTVAYAIATSTGTLKAIITETISGTVSITNTYNLEQNPPPPTPPVRRDPLSGWVDIFVNGVLVQQVMLGTDPNPGFTRTNTVNGNVVTRSVSYTYGDYLVGGTASVGVFAGDFVEFFVYAKIHGDIDGYSAPDGFTIVSSSGTSSATANIRSAHIQTSS